MFVMQALTAPVTPNSSILLIAGMAWYLFVIVALVVIFVAIIIFILWGERYKRLKTINYVIDKVVLEVLPATGGNIPIEFVPCEWNKGEARKFEDHTRGTFVSAHWVKAPEGHTVDCYLLPDEHDYNMWWPVGSPRNEQIQVPVYIVHKNRQWPECPHVGSNWDDVKRIQVSATMNALSKSEATTLAIMSPQMAFAEQLARVAERLKWVMLSFFSGAGNVILTLAVLAMIYLILKDMGAVKTFLIGK